ncbi:MAG: CBS domain-containing protein [Gallionella sp.]
MAIGDICNREVVVAGRDCTILEAAQLMRQHHVGDVVIVEKRGGINAPAGLVTDRDLFVEIIAPAIDQAAITVGDLMMSDLATARESPGVSETIEYMRAKGERRVPVVVEYGVLVGILALDDLLEPLSAELLSRSRLVRHEQKREMTSRR